VATRLPGGIRGGMGDGAGMAGRGCIVSGGFGDGPGFAGGYAVATRLPGRIRGGIGDGTGMAGSGCIVSGGFGVAEAIVGEGFVDADEGVEGADIVVEGIARATGFEEIGQAGIGDLLGFLDCFGQGRREDGVELGRSGERGVHHADRMAPGPG